MLCCLFCAHIYQLVNIGINCVFISISLCHGGVLGIGIVHGHVSIQSFAEMSLPT
jgi:hypothetical protein